MASAIARDLNLARDLLQNAVHISQDFVVPKADEPVTMGFDDAGSHFVAVSIGMLTAIQFDSEAQTAACKINNGLADRKLAGELDPQKFAIPQIRPEFAFRISRIAAQSARGLSESLFRHRSAPIPNPFPQGKGLVVLAAIFTAPLVAQNPAMTPPPLAEWPGAEIVEGVAFQGNGSVKLELGAGGLPVIAFWRPVLFKEETKKPVAGRMDCKVVATEQPFDEDDFDPDARHASIATARERQGFKDMDRLRDIGDDIRQLDVVGRRANPRQHYVLSYILVRDGQRMIDIRRNCTFIYGTAISRPDVLPYVYRYTHISYAFEPGAGA